MSRPILFLDVDGPLSPYAAEPGTLSEGYTTLAAPEGGWAAEGNQGLSVRRRPARVRLDPEHGRELLLLDYELCWATSWMADANRWLAPVLGLPFVDFGAALFQDRPDGVHWKTAPLVEHARGRPFAWVDDEQSDLDQAYVTAHHRAPGLLHHVNPRIGLRADDFGALAAFARSLGAGATP
ncbi:HAD domain-containing protein [Streptomyces varsoviensis]|uniref:Secreted protein n=1 Tax=Streptomyces varsoviensis TaxID=67373 RepID=A0ABR5J381_9ACTN|nr:hypothetical protein [Streptomyces varsoviensis]KOG87867.1 hypothetical protein ADK38_23005 [Streptomyces varsoviensis]